MPRPCVLSRAAEAHLLQPQKEQKYEVINFDAPRCGLVRYLDHLEPVDRSGRRP
jgi:hypothetical protein